MLFLLGVCCYMVREWELSSRLGMRTWIAVPYSAPVAAATAVGFFLKKLKKEKRATLLFLFFKNIFFRKDKKIKR